MPRHPISDEQRKALRRWYQRQHPKPRQSDAAKWFEIKFGHRITQSTVSESLSDRFAYLDTPSTSNTTSFRQRQPQWPLLEAILFEWNRQIEQQGGVVTGDILLVKAQEIWPRIPQYQDQPPPSFSTGWLEKFKKRHNIKQRSQHGEASSVPEGAEEEMRSIQTLCGEYKEEDIYNMDETGLFWRQAPSSGLASEPRSGIRKDKSRISVVCCVNFTGSQRLPLWLLGKAKQPRPLKNVNLEAMGCVWRANTKGWMTTAVMIEWLRAFYSSIPPDRSVLLLMDNLKAHISGVELAPPPPNIRIQWLPANATSLYQPLDQGIISNLKHHYKKRWLQFMIQQFEQHINPLQSMNLYLTVRWITQAWSCDINNTTIYRCFRKAKILPQQQPITLPAEPPLDLSPLYQTAQRAGNIQDAMSLEAFLNPEGEDPPQEHDPQGVDLEDLIQQHTGQVMEGEEAAVEDEPGVEIVVPSSSEALRAVELLQMYAEHQEGATASDIRHFMQFERLIKVTISNQQQQRTLDGWFT